MTKQKTISFRLPEELFNRLDGMANIAGKTKSEAIVGLLEYALAILDSQIDKAFNWAGLKPESLSRQEHLHYIKKFSTFWEMVDKGLMDVKTAKEHFELEGDIYRKRKKNG